MAPIVAAYASMGLAPTLAAAEAAIRVTQNTDESVSMGLAFARILYSLITVEATTPSAAVKLCVGALKDPRRVNPNPVTTPAPPGCRCLANFD